MPRVDPSVVPPRLHVIDRTFRPVRGGVEDQGHVRVVPAVCIRTRSQIEIVASSRQRRRIDCRIGRSAVLGGVRAWRRRLERARHRERDQTAPARPTTAESLDHLCLPDGRKLKNLDATLSRAVFWQGRRGSRISRVPGIPPPEPGDCPEPPPDEEVGRILRCCAREGSAAARCFRASAASASSKQLRTAPRRRRATARPSSASLHARPQVPTPPPSCRRDRRRRTPATRAPARAASPPAPVED